MAKILFDIECDGLLNECTQMWVLVTHNMETKEIQHWRGDEDGWKEVLSGASHLSGHNIASFDIPVLEKLYGWTPSKTTKIQDTLIMSQALNYKRFGAKGHSLEVWGEELGFPKGDFSDWSQYSDEMLVYCKRDVELNVRVYNVLMIEYKTLVAMQPKFSHYLKAEHAAAKWSAKASLHGWPFDRKKGEALMVRLETEMAKAVDALESRLGFKCVPIDKKNGEVESKRPRWTKAGCYDKFTADYFEVDPWSGFDGEDRPINGEYSRIKIEPLKLSSPADVKVFLFRNGWEPTEWNVKKVEGAGFVKTTPKITDDSLEFLGGDGKLYTDYTSTKSRHDILKTWLKNLDANDRLHGDMMLIGTPSMRARHSIIVNVPSADSAWGKEMRELFICKEGWKIVGCDSASNQARLLAHYLGDQKYIETLIHGDIHTYNAEILTQVLDRMGIKHVVPRPAAKRILYAFLFGASGGKLWSYVFGGIDAERGNKLKSGFLKAVPGFKNLLDKLEKIYGSTKKFGLGYIPGIAGNRLYVDSFHKLLVYLLQGGEKATCSAALMLAAERLELEGIPYIPLIYYHDEIDFMVPEEHAERAAAIGKQAFADGPKLFGVTIMDGGAKIGNSWYEVH
jgi:DNA polymerase I